MKGPKGLHKEFYDQFLQLKSTKLPVKIDKWGEPYLPGIRGRVTPYSNDGQVLCMYTDKPRILARMLELPWITPHQIADQEGYVLFHVKNIKKAKIFLRLKNRHNVNPKSLANLTSQHRFKVGENGQIKAQKSTKGRGKIWCKTRSSFKLHQKTLHEEPCNLRNHRSIMKKGC